MSTARRARRNPHGFGVGLTVAAASVVGAVVAVGAVVGGCGSFGAADVPGSDGGDAGVDADVRDAAGDAPIPPGCVMAAEPREAPKCVSSDVGVFVSSTGKDDATGKREAPVKSVGKAIELAVAQGLSRVYLCAGTYAESVKLTSAVSLYGGFSCKDWSYTAQKAAIAPAAVGYALEIADVPSSVEVMDLTLTALAGTALRPSSVAAFVRKSPKVLMRRVSLIAGNGFDQPLAGGGANLANPPRQDWQIHHDRTGKSTTTGLS